MTEGKRPHLRLIQGGRDRGIALGTLEVWVAPRTELPFAVDALVFEEDSFLVMSTSPEVIEPPIHPVRLMTELIDVHPEPPGSVLRREGYPLRLLAVVYDFESDPPCQDAWVFRALNELWVQADRCQVRSLALPFLGFRRSEVERRRFVSMLVRSLRKASPKYLKKIWFMVASDLRVEVSRMLKDYISGPAGKPGR